MVARNQLGTALGVLFVVLALVGVGTLSMAGAVGQETGENGSNVTITAGAAGTASAAPDLAVINVGVEASADSAETARTEVADNVSEMREALAEANVSDDQIKTTYYYVQTERDDNGTVTYHAVHAFELRVPVENAGSLTDTAIDGGATRIDGVQFTLADETSRQLRGDALQAALSNARADADVIASATGVEVQAVRSVETSNGGVGPVFTEDTSGGDGGDTTFDPGEVTVTAHVTVTYEAS